MLRPDHAHREGPRGGGLGRISKWDGTRWTPKTGWFGAYRDIVREQVKKSAEEFKKAGK